MNKNVGKKVLATTLATNMLLGGASIVKTQNVASAWWWQQKHTQEEIDSLYRENNNAYQCIMEATKKLDDLQEAGSFIGKATELKDECDNKEKTYDNAVDFQKKFKDLQGKIDVKLNLQEITRRQKAEEAEQEARLAELERLKKAEEAEIEHKRKLEEAEAQHRREMEAQKLLMEKEERDRLEAIHNAKVSLSDKFFAIKRKSLKDVELQENIDHLNSLADELDNKIESIDNLNRVDAVEVLITEFLEEVEVVLSSEAKLRQEEFEKKLKESKENLSSVAVELQDLLSNLDEENERFSVINEAIESYVSVIESLSNLEDVNSVQKDFDELQAEINSLLELQAQKEEEKRVLEELERQIENSRDPKAQLEMLSEGKISLDDVIGGNQKAKAKALTLLKAYERYNKGGKIVPSKGLLFYGPPGTGKTSFVTAFAAEQGLELFFVNPSLVMGDNGERKVLETFEQAKKAAQVSSKPVILLIDEIDAVAQKRSSSSSDKVLVMLMNEIDKLKASDNVIVLATTNRREALDQAIIRSGRLDQSVEVGYPNSEDKEKIVNIYLKHLKVAEDFNIKAYTEKMRGFCGADIKRVVDIAISSAMDRQNVESFSALVITNADFQSGIATIMDEKTTVY